MKERQLGICYDGLITRVHMNKAESRAVQEIPRKAINKALNTILEPNVLYGERKKPYSLA